MPRSGQIIPKYGFPHIETYINDYTEISDTPSSSSGDTSMLFVFNSPKGVDGKMTTISGGLAEFLTKFGMGPASIYGQPLLNAYACAASGTATLQCMRIAAPDATYANLAIFAKYKVVTTGEDESAVKSMEVKFFTKSYENMASLNVLDSIVAEDGTINFETPDADGYTNVHLFTLACKGRGTYGQTFGIKIQNLPTLNKENDYQNYYVEIYNKDDIERPESFSVVLYDEAQLSDSSVYIDDVINDPDTGSDLIEMYTNMDGFYELFNKYKEIVPDTDLTIESFDAILGAHKTTKLSIPKYNIIPTAGTDTVNTNIIVFNSTYGTYLENGSNGIFDIKESNKEDAIKKFLASKGRIDGSGAYINKSGVAQADMSFVNAYSDYYELPSVKTTASSIREDAIEREYKNAFSGETDPNIKSKTKFPVNIILDANYPASVKQLIASLVTQRTDCVGLLDCGTNIATKEEPLTWVQTNLADYASTRCHYVLPLYGKVKCPYSKKLTTVTWTYLAASALPNHFYVNDGKHVPFAGANYGKLSGYIKNTWFPVYDIDIDAEIMEKLNDAQINYAKILTDGSMCIGTQGTRQTKISDLSELNAVLILLDIKRDCENLVSTFEYRFNESSDIGRFNKAIEPLMNKYADAQVRSISARFGKTEWEADRNILHLYVEIANKDLVKTVITEIDIV